MHRAAFLFFSLFVLVSLKAASQKALQPPTNALTGMFSLKVLPQNFYKQCLPFSCKSELQLQKLTALPLYIRLGSKDYVDYLEKKPNVVRLEAGGLK